MNEQQLRAIFDKTEGHCHFCGDSVIFERRGWKEGDLEGYWEVDYIIQRGKGGATSVDNCLPACTRCNRLRWHRTGAQVRELLFLGLVARDEIRRGSDVGQAILSLWEQRLLKNRQRRNRPK